MRKDLTAIAVILDKSGSMHSLASDTIGNFNKFLAEQKAFPGEAVFTLCTFNSEHDLVHDFIPINDVPDLNETTYSPSGGTSLLDAIGKTIDALGKKLSAMSEEERPGKVLTVILTDGAENSSTDYTHAQVKSMVEHQQSKYSWEFMFFGASMDQIAAGHALGVSKGNTMGYVATAAGVQDLYNNISRSTSVYRSK